MDQSLDEKLHSVTYPGPDDPPVPSVAEMRSFPFGVKATLVETFRRPAGSVIDPISWPEVMSKAWPNASWESAVEAGDPKSFAA